MTHPTAAALTGNWVHSHEEDAPDRVVYRPSTFTFPPSRGRGGFDLNPDGSLDEYGPGAADRPASRPGRWEVGADGCLRFFPDGADRPARVLKIASLTPDKLVIEKGCRQA
jgi:hypothetical protein